MSASVEFATDPEVAEEVARAFLHSDPLRHNVLCTLLAGRRSARQAIRFWWACVDGRVTGVVFQSPESFPAVVSRLEESSVEPLARAVAEVAGRPIPGVSGLAHDAARFAGEYATITRRPGRAVEGQRIYEVQEVVPPEGVAGGARVATAADTELVTRWLEGFEVDTGMDGSGPSDAVERTERARHFIASGRLHLWEADGQPTTSTFASSPEAGVVRIGFVFTPPEQRGRGYASALVAAVSSATLRDGARCILYTQLANPTSNAIYQRLGYRPIGELVRYAFG